jgi:hypothetical protein
MTNCMGKRVLQVTMILMPSLRALTFPLSIWWIKVDLDLLITQLEIDNSIMKMSSGKTPGDNGLGIEFYKCFKKQLPPILLKLFYETLGSESMPPSLCRAIIALLPRPGKDPLELGSFRPLSLLNSDYKILAKTLALRLETVIQ